MDLTVVVSAAAAVVAVPVFVVLTTRASLGPRWWAPAALALGFAGWSAYAIAEGGPFGFVREHVGTPWETQIWMDLLLMGATAWWLLQPRLRAAGIRPWPWLAAVLATGSIGMLILVARLLLVEARTRRPRTGEDAPARVEAA